MQRYLKYRRYRITKRCVLVFLLMFAVSLLFLVKFMAIEFAVEEKFDIPRKIIGDEEREIRQLMLLTERVRFNDQHFYDIIRFSKFKSERQSHTRDFLKGWKYTYFLPEYKVPTIQAPSWFAAHQIFCHGCFVSHGKRVAHLKDVIIDPSFSENVRGGEPLETVGTQTTDLEYLVLTKGYFYLNTNNEIPHYNDKQTSRDFLVFLDALSVENMKFDADKVLHKTTIVTIRHEYANLYHTMMDWYDIFLLMVLHHIDQFHIQILWLDGHPQSPLDDTWKTLFGEVQQARNIKEPTLCKHMIWNAIGATCPLNQHKSDILPFSEEFRHFFLSQHGIFDNHRINCQSLQIRFIYRHPYSAHPRNPSGYMTRKIENENEVLIALRDALPQDDVDGMLLETFSMKQQLEIISQTDILIGMHGAGLSHILFLPNTSGVIELLPKYFSPSNKHFQAMAKWRQLDYIMWKNGDPDLEHKNHFTVVPPDLLVEMVRKLRALICDDKVSVLDTMHKKPKPTLMAEKGSQYDKH